MKKVLGLFLVILLSSVSVYAQKDKRGNKGGDPAQRIEKIISDLKLDEKQAADFRKVQDNFRSKMKAEREAAKADRDQMREKMKSLRTEMDTEMKKILNDEQYKQYQEKMERQRPDGPRKGGSRKG